MTVVAAVGRLAASLLVLTAGYVAVRAISRVVRAALDRVGFDATLGRRWLPAPLSRLPWAAGDVVSKAVFAVLFLFVLQAAMATVGDNPVSELLAVVITLLPWALATVAVGVLLVAAGATTRRVVEERSSIRR